MKSKNKKLYLNCLKNYNILLNTSEYKLKLKKIKEIKIKL